MTPPETLPEPVESPCIGVCTLDSHAICVGCLRSADEITRWAVMDSAERDAIMDRLEGVGSA